jgi:hypothetical protein
MPAITITSSSSAAVVFGCTAETGIIINSFTRTTTREKVELTNDQGDVVAVSFFKPMASITIEGVANGLTTGLGLAAPGVALTINNTTSANGITSGSVLVNSTTRSQTSEAFAAFSVDASQYPLITG